MGPGRPSHPRILAAAFFGLLWLGRGPGAAADEPVEERLKKQEERLSAAEERLKKQEEQIATLLQGMGQKDEEIKRLEGELAAAKPSPPPAVPSAPAKSSPFRLSGFLQADWAIFRQSSQDEVSSGDGAPLN